MTATLSESENYEDIVTLQIIEEVKSARLVNYIISSFKSKSVILELNQNGSPMLVEFPIIVEDWELTNKRLDSILTNKGVREEDRTKLLRLLNYHANRITDHFTARALSQLHEGRKAKLERIEKAKNTPPVEVPISRALRMHEGNVRVRDMISSGFDRIEKMITRVYYRCGECDAINELADYRQTRPRCSHEIPSFDPQKKKCKMTRTGMNYMKNQ